MCVICPVNISCYIIIYQNYICTQVLKTAMRAILERCVEDEIEVLAILPASTGEHLLTDVLFDVLQHFVPENCILERIDIISDSLDTCSYLVIIAFIL